MWFNLYALHSKQVKMKNNLCQLSNISNKYSLREFMLN